MSVSSIELLLFVHSDSLWLGHICMKRGELIVHSKLLLIVIGLILQYISCAIFVAVCLSHRGKLVQISYQICVFSHSLNVFIYQYPSTKMMENQMHGIFSKINHVAPLHRVVKPCFGRWECAESCTFIKYAYMLFWNAEILVSQVLMYLVGQFLPIHSN